MTELQPRRGVELPDNLVLRSVSRGMRGLHLASPNLAARAAFRLWTSPRRFTPPKREHAVTESAERFRVPYGLGSLQGYSWGEGDPVLLVHGWEGRGPQMGHFVQPLVEKGHRVIAFDGPGHGRSDGKRATLPAFAEAVHAVLRIEPGVRRIVTHSFGGPSTLFALSSGRKIERMALVSPPDASRALDRFSDVLRLPEDQRARLKAYTRERFGVSPSDLTPERLFQGIEGDLMVVHDTQDRMVPYGDGEMLAEHSGAEFHATDGLGHLRILRDQDVVTKVTDFIADR